MFTLKAHRSDTSALLFIHKPIKCTSFRQGLPESRHHGWFRPTIHGTGYPLPGGYDMLPGYLSAQAWDRYKESLC
ncbi:MAG TPA: hypothetical protein VIJ25_15705 [Methylococcales bacterium]